MIRKVVFLVPRYLSDNNSVWSVSRKIFAAGNDIFNDATDEDTVDDTDQLDHKQINCSHQNFVP